MAASDTIARRIFVSGHVQGVGYRAFVKVQAEKLDINGFVRNRKDRSVEVLIAGRPEQIETMIALCYEGPPTASVRKIKISEAELPSEKGFHELPTE